MDVKPSTYVGSIRSDVQFDQFDQFENINPTRITQISHIALNCNNKIFKTQNSKKPTGTQANQHVETVQQQVLYNNGSVRFETQGLIDQNRECGETSAIKHVRCDEIERSIYVE